MAFADDKIGDGRPPFWAIAATAALIALGFRPRRFTQPSANDKPSAPAPVGVYPPGWQDGLLSIYRNISDHRLVALAAGMTFYTLLAIFPALAALVAIYGLFADPQSITDHLETLSGLLPAGALDVAKDQLTRLASKGASTLGFAFIVGFAVSLWSANAAMKALFDTLNVVFDEKEKRGLLQLNALSLRFTLAGIVFVLVALGAVIVLPATFQYLGLSGAADLIPRLGRWPALFLVLSLALAFIYCYGPSRERTCWRWISWGSMSAAALWLAASVLFSWYTASFGSYNETYGSLGAVIGFMTWLWISAIAILLGAEVDAELERYRRRFNNPEARNLSALRRRR